MKPGWNLDRTLVEPSAEPLGSPTWICPRECPETFTMAEAIAVGEQNLSNQHSTYDKGAGNINYLKYGTIYKLRKLMELHSTNRAVLAGKQVASHKMSNVN